MARYIFITGGVVSSLGKGLGSAALGALLQARGFKVRLRKLDPYLNVDPGTMKQAANLLTRLTGIIAACFIVTSITLAILAGNARERRSIVDQPAAPIEQPVVPSGPTVPLAK